MSGGEDIRTRLRWLEKSRCVWSDEPGVSSSRFKGIGAQYSVPDQLRPPQSATRCGVHEGVCQSSHSQNDHRDTVARDRLIFNLNGTRPVGLSPTKRPGCCSFLHARVSDAKMATEVLATETLHLAGSLDSRSNNSPRTVVASFNYYDDPCDGSPPQPVVIGG